MELPLLRDICAAVLTDQHEAFRSLHFGLVEVLWKLWIFAEVSFLNVSFPKKKLSVLSVKQFQASFDRLLSAARQSGVRRA